MRVRYLPDALREMHEAVVWYHERNPMVARRFTEMIRMSERLISEFPDASPQLAEGQRTYRIPRFRDSLIH